MLQLDTIVTRIKQATWADYAAALALLVPFLLILGRAPADAAVIISCVLFLVEMIRTRDTTWLRSTWVQVGLVTWCYLFLSATLAIADQHTALMRALTWGRWLIITASITFWYSKRPWWNKTVGWSLAALIVVLSIDTLVQYVFGTSLSGHPKPDLPGRLTGPFTRLVIGIFMARLFWPAFAQILHTTQQSTGFLKRIVLPLGFIGVSALVILLSGERMAFLLTGLSLGIFFLFAKGFRKPLLACGIPLVLAVIAVIVTQPNIRARALEANTMIHNFDQSGYGVIFNNALMVWKMSPFTGVGPKNFVQLCEKDGQALGYKDAIPETPQFDCARHPHNPYLEWLADTGVIGVALFTLLILLWCKDAVTTVWRNRSLPAADYLPLLCCAVGLIPFVWPLQGNMSVFSNWNGVLFWWTIGVLLGGLQNPQRND